MRARRVELRNLFENGVRRSRVLFSADASLFDVSGVFATRAVHHVVLAVFRWNHEFMRSAAADRAVVSFDRQVRQSATFKDSAIRGVHLFVRLVEGIEIRMERVRVLHEEFARAQYAKFRAFFITELRLDLIERERKLTVARYVL